MNLMVNSFEVYQLSVKYNNSTMELQENNSASVTSEKRILFSEVSFEIRDVAFLELEAKICGCKKVVVLQTYIDRIPSSTEFEYLASMFHGLAMFIRVNIIGIDNNIIMKLSEKYNWNFNGISHGQIIIFEDSTECSSTKLTNDEAELKSKMEKCISDAIEIRKTRRKGLLETSKNTHHYTKK